MLLLMSKSLLKRAKVCSSRIRRRTVNRQLLLQYLEICERKTIWQLFPLPQLLVNLLPSPNSSLRLEDKDRQWYVYTVFGGHGNKRRHMRVYTKTAELEWQSDTVVHPLAENGTSDGWCDRRAILGIDRYSFRFLSSEDGLTMVVTSIR